MGMAQDSDMEQPVKQRLFGDLVEMMEEHVQGGETIPSRESSIKLEGVDSEVFDTFNEQPMTVTLTDDEWSESEIL